MTREYARSNPSFFRLIRRCMLLLAAGLLLLALVIPAPLQEPAMAARVPNPAKSAWFLLWIQELVSWSKHLIHAVLLLLALFFLLPWLPGPAPAQTAHWWRRDQLPLTAVALAVSAAIVALTVIAMFFRGKNWDLTVPF